MNGIKWPFKPYAWQRLADRKLVAYMQRDVILVAPCGYGKEAVVARHAVRWVLQGCRVVWLTARAFSGERNKVKELQTLLEANPQLRVKAVSFRAKEGLCNYLPEWAGKHGADVSKIDVNDFCSAARKSGLCPYRRDKDGLDVPRWTGFISEDAAPRGCCKYYWLKEAARRADIVIMDYNYAVHPSIRRAFSTFFDKKTVVFFDEAHALPKRLEDAFAARLSTRTVKAAVAEAEGKFADEKLQKAFEHVKARFPEAADHLRNVLNRILRIADEKKEELEAEVERSGEPKTLIAAEELLTPSVKQAADYLSRLRVGETLRDLKFAHSAEIGGGAVRSNVLAVERFLNLAQKIVGKNWACMYVEASEKRVAVGAALLDARVMLKPLLNRVGATLYYSGTLYPKAFTNHLDVNAEVLSKFTSPFPPETRLDIFTGDVEVTRRTLENREEAEKVSEMICEWFNVCSKPGVVPMAVMTAAQFEKLNPLLEAKGLKLQMIEWVSRDERESYLNRLFDEAEHYAVDREEGSFVVASPYGWPSMSMDFPEKVRAVLMVGVPVARQTPENRQKVKYFADILAHRGLEVEKAWAAARRWIITVPAIQYHVQANSRARAGVGSVRVVSTWLDLRYVRDKALVGLVKKLTKRKNVAVVPDYKEAIQLTSDFLSL